MRKIIIILLIGFISFYTEAQNKYDSLIYQKFDQLEKSILKVTKQYNESNRDSLKISLEHFDNLTKSINDSGNWWKEIAPSIIAILVVIISTFGAVFIGIKQIKTLTTNAATQLKSQEFIAQEQLRIAREQIQETSRMTIIQVRANNISLARINWIQNLRNELSQFMGQVTLINFYLQDVIDLFDKGDKAKSEELYNEQTDGIKNARQYAFKIKLFLNKEEIDHRELERLIDNYYKSALEDYSTVQSDFETLSNEILTISRKILKDAWEQAKNEGNN